MHISFIRKVLTLCVVGIAVFVMSILTNLSGLVIPLAKESMALSLTQAGVLPFAFFIAYAVMSIPAGVIHEKFRARGMMFFAFTCTALAIFVFLMKPFYYVFLFSLFIAGAGMSIVQVVINPLVKNVGGEEYFSFYLIFGQFIYGGGSIISPLLFSCLLSKAEINGLSGSFVGIIENLMPVSFNWISIYWVCLILCIAVVILLLIIRFPVMQLESKDKIGGIRVLFELLKDVRVWIFFFGIFTYAGVEQGISNWMTKFLETYHGLNPESAGALILSRFWLCISLGGALGVIIVFFMDVKKMLGTFAVIAMILLSISLFGKTKIAVYTFPICGLFLAIMYPSILSLGMNTITKHPGALSGILCTGISGAAVVALLIGFLGDIIGLRGAMCLIFLALLYILFIAIWAKPIVKNKKIF